MGGRRNVNVSFSLSRSVDKPLPARKGWRVQHNVALPSYRSSRAKEARHAHASASASRLKTSLPHPFFLGGRRAGSGRQPRLRLPLWPAYLRRSGLWRLALAACRLAQASFPLPSPHLPPALFTILVGAVCCHIAAMRAASPALP